MRTHASLPCAGGAGESVTLSDLRDEATVKADKLQAEISKLVARCDYKGAFNKSMAALQASLAREARRRPVDAIALYQYFTEWNISLVREMPGYRAEEGDPQ